MNLDKVQLILDAAITVFAEKGFHKTTTTEIAKQAGVAVGTIYNYFASKDEVLERIFALEAEKRQAYARELDKEPYSAVDKLELLLQLHFSALANNPDLARVILAEKSVVLKQSEGFCPDGGLVQIIEALLQQSQKIGEFRGICPYTSALLIFGMIEIVMAKSLNQPEFNMEDATREIVQLLRQGIV